MTNKEKPTFDDADPGFEEGVGPKVVEHIHLESRTKFFPWHKPRKQYLRTEQWANSVEKLVDYLNLKERGQPLNYLSLPGPDLLDIRTLHPIFIKKQVNLSFTGLNSGDDDDSDSSHLNAALLNQVRSLPYIDQDSSVVPDHFEHLAQKKSIAYQRIIEARKSFDVINIDLCRSLAEGVSGVKGPNIVNALFNLVRHQAKSRDKDWILFITTRSNKDMVDEGTLQKFVEWLNSVNKNDGKLIKNLIEKDLISNQDLTDEEIDFTKLFASSHSNTFILGLSHWILRNLFNGPDRWKVDMLPQFGYHVSLKGKECDMISLGFMCKKIKMPDMEDDLKIAHVEQIPEPDLDKILTSCGEKFIRRIHESRDVDILLYKDEELYKESLEKSTELMISAQYDEAAYRKFSEEERVKISLYLEGNNLV